MRLPRRRAALIRSPLLLLAATATLAAAASSLHAQTEPPPPPTEDEGGPALELLERVPQGTPVSSSTDTLTLDEVLLTAIRSHPELAAAEFKRQGARSKRVAARGAFDLQLDGGGEVYPIDGKKAYGVLDFTLLQPTTLWGLQLFAGWMGTYGDVPLYKDQWYQKIFKPFSHYKSEPDAGERGRLHAGVALPLLRNRTIDDRRATLRQAAFRIDEADSAALQKRLMIELKATEAYFDWIAAGQQVQIAERLLEVALIRQAQIEEKVKLGAEAPIYGVENRKYILKRQNKLLQSAQKLQESALKLSIYWRPTEQGDPVMPQAEMLPADWPPIEIPPEEIAREQIELAIEQLPRWREFAAMRDVAAVDVNYYDNQMLPQLDVTGGVTQPLDFEAKTSVRLTLDFTTPLQRREARGSRDAAEANVARIDAEQRFFEDQTRSEIDRALVTLRAAQGIVALAEAELELSLQLEEAERIRLDAGDSTLLIVNLREQATADAAMQLVEAERDLQIALARYRLSLGQSLLGEIELPEETTTP